MLTRAIFIRADSGKAFAHVRNCLSMEKMSDVEKFHQQMMLNIRIIFTNYDIITDFLNLAFCSEDFISIKNRILAPFNIKKNQI